MRRCLEENMDVVLIGVYLIHVALEVLLKDTIRQFCEPVLKGSVYDRMPVFCYYNQMIFQVITTVSIRSIAQVYALRMSLYNQFLLWYNNTIIKGI